jgi:hypothetical protein
VSAESLARDLAAALAELLPGKLADVDAAEAPAPVGDWDELQVRPNQEGPATVYPTVEIVVRDERIVGRELDDDTGRVLDHIQYGVRLFGTVRGSSYAETDRLRKRLVRALRELVQSPDTPGAAVPSSLRASYSSISREQNARTLAGGFLDVLLAAIEPAVTSRAVPLPGEPTGERYVFAGIRPIDDPTA